MNSDKIERLQRASAMTAPEASRSTETPFLRPCCASTWTQRRDASHWDCATWGLCASRWDLAICLCFFWDAQNVETTALERAEKRRDYTKPGPSTLIWGLSGFRTGSYGCLWHASCVCECVCTAFRKKEVCSPPSVRSHKVWHRVWSRRADNESCIAFISALAVVFACARDPWMWPFLFQPTSALFPPSLFQ